LFVSTFNQTFYRTILDTLPVPIFIVDNDVRIHDLNLAASQLFSVNKREIFKMRGGDALHCLNAYSTAEGCGRSQFCESCVIRNAVTGGLSGEGTSRKRMKFQIASGDRRTEMDLLITATKLPGTSLVLLVMEDVSELTRLKGILPICVRCRKVRDDNQYWKQVEQYFEEAAGMAFSHGICPGCWEKEMKSLEDVNLG
jgi:PAS domain-containing protein